MELLKTEVKDIANYFDKLCTLNLCLLGKFYNEDGVYIGCMSLLCRKELIISKSLYQVWRNRVRVLWVDDMNDTTVFEFVVLKGEEK